MLGSSHIGHRCLRNATSSIRSVRCNAGVAMPACTHTPRPYDGLPYDKAVELRSKYFNPNPKHYYEQPVMMVEGKMQWLWDHSGKRYLDMWGGIVTVGVGHAHPKVNAAVAKQMDKIQHITNFYLHPLQGEYSEAIVKHMPKEHDWVCFFTNSGSEANDLATLLARTHTGNFEYVVLRNGYHGMSEGTRGLTSCRNWKFQAPSFGIKHALHPSTYRGVFGDGPDAADRYVADLRNQLAETGSPRIAGFVAEPIMGVGGVYEYPATYLPKVYDAIRDHGGVCTADEVQTGWGRLGTDFWGFEYAGCVPDIAVTAKSIGNGWPLGAVIARREIAESFKGAVHFNTYGGNPVSLAAGLATLRVIEEEGMQENSHKRGNEILAGLRKLQSKYDIVGDVRGRGLMTAIELVTDRKTKAPATDQATRVQALMLEEGLITGKAGTYANCFRFVPPMCITAEDVEFFLYSFEKSLAAVA